MGNNQSIDIATRGLYEKVENALFTVILHCRLAQKNVKNLQDSVASLPK